MDIAVSGDAVIYSAVRVDAALYATVILRLVYLLSFTVLFGGCCLFYCRYTTVSVRAVLYSAVRVDAALLVGIDYGWSMCCPLRCN